MQSHVLAALFFAERYVRYFGSLHPAFEMSCDTEYLKKQLLIFSETWSPSFFIVCNCFDDFRTNLPKISGQFHRSKTQNFQKDVEYVPKKSFWALVGLILWLCIKMMFWELAEISLHETIRVACSNAESRFGCAIFPRTLRSVLWLFTSCVWDVLRYRILIKTAFDFFQKRGLRRFVLCAIVLMILAQTLRKLLGEFTEIKTQNFQKDVEYVPKMSFWALLCFFLWL